METFLTESPWGPVVLVGVFLVSSVLGYIIIKRVPSLLHTPLMSGMNALSGVTVLGAVIAGAVADAEKSVVALIIALVAVALAMVNVAGGFFVTHKMLRMFNKKNDAEEEKKE